MTDPQRPTDAGCVERVARAIHETQGTNPDTLYQHNFEGDWPEDDRREYADPFTGEPRVMLFHKAWRRSEKAARAAIAALSASGGDAAELAAADMREAVGVWLGSKDAARIAVERMCDEQREDFKSPCACMAPGGLGFDKIPAAVLCRDTYLELWDYVWPKLAAAIRALPLAKQEPQS